MSQQKPITRIMVQSCPRADSITALYLLTQTFEGRKKYSGIENAAVGFWGTGTMSPDNMTWRQYLEGGTILIGVGGGPFDEHPSAEFGDRKEEKLSATLLVARDLGLDKSMLYRRLVQRTTENDLNAVTAEDTLSNIIKLMYRGGDDIDPMDVIGWAFTALDAMVDHQRQFMVAIDKFSKEAMVHTRERPDGSKFDLAFIKSDNKQMWAAARYRNKQLAVLIQQRTSGRVQIFGNPNLGVNMQRIAGAIRYNELMARGQQTTASEHMNTLDQPGQMPLVPCWCYQMPGHNLLNGSETASNLEPTRLTAEWIRHLVLENIEFVNTPVNTTREPVEA